MFRQFIILLYFKFCIITFIQCQTYLKCKFDDDDNLPCRLIPVGIAPELDVKDIVPLLDPSMDPFLPLSDVTSITSATIGNSLHCKLPYQFNENSKDIYFCSNVTYSSNSSSCITTDNSIQECILGKYVALQLKPAENQTYYIEVLGTTSGTCLKFYYYITRANVGQIVVWCTDIMGSIIQQIGKASDVPYNGWHPIEFNFSPNVSNYNIHFDLQSSEDLDGLIFIALDEIIITDGVCEHDIIETSTNIDQTDAQQTFITTATISTITTFTPEESELSSEQLLSSSIPSTMTPVPSSSQDWSDSTISTQPLSSEAGQLRNDIVSLRTTIITTFITAPSPITPLFRCDFSTECFAKDQIIITNGNEFNPTDSSEPPRGPTSDVTSITQPTDNYEICKLPYKPEINNSTDSTDWDMWFCYNNQCPTPSGQMANCTSGSYGLISLDSSETSRIIIDSLNSIILIRDLIEEQCLQFYYYFTVYNGEDWGQQIQLWIRPNNQSDNQFLIETLTFNDMKNNGWHFREITFNLTFSDYTLVFLFEISKDNQTDDPKMNKTIYFALDNIELYNYNCSYVRNPVIDTTSTLLSTMFTTTTKKEEATATPPQTHFGLILGLSIGLGVLVVIIIIGSIIYIVKKKARSRNSYLYNYDKYFPLETATNRTKK